MTTWGTHVSADERRAAIEGVARQVEQGYVDSAAGAEMAAALRGRAARGAYDSIGEGRDLALALTRDLQAAGEDLHLTVWFSPEPLPPEPEPGVGPSDEELAQFRSRLARDNYGLRRAEVLPGNIGCIRLDVFAPPDLAGATYAAALALVAETDALIVDLRENGGSISPDAIPMVCSYFFEHPTHLIDLAWSGQPTRQLWTWAYVPGRRYLGRPIFVLTSRCTFSGAEEFAYDLQNLGRATVVGETTGGGANPGGTRRASDHFSVFVPFGRVTSPVTRTNWEGVGVTPDIAVPAGRALLEARVAAARQLLRAAGADRRDDLERAEREAAAALARFQRVRFELPGHQDASEVQLAGSFNCWSPRSTPMARVGEGWSAEVEVEPGRHTYRFVVDRRPLADPAAPRDHDGDDADSVRFVPE